MKDYGIELNQRELDDCFQYFDRDKSGFVDFDEFLIGVRGEMSESRKSFIRIAFDKLDMDKSGLVTLEELLSLYDVSHNPDVKSGKLTPKQAIKLFAAQWDRDGNETISYEEFEEYYRGVSASIDGDTYFELMMRNSWRIAGGEGQAANTANRRVLVTRPDGSQAVVTVNDDLGLTKDKDAIRGRLAKQGEQVSGLDLYGGLDATERARNPGGRSQGKGAPENNPKIAWGNVKR